MNTLEPNEKLEGVGLSKFLCGVLRHNPECIDLQLDEYGYADIDKLISQASTHGIDIKLIDILELHNFNAKFKLKDIQFIKAINGHTFKIKSEEKGKRPPVLLYHGTKRKLQTQILTNGLKPTKLSMVYFFEDYEQAYAFKGRNEPTVIIVNSQKMYQDGYQFYQTPQGVWYTEHCPIKYLTVKANYEESYLSEMKVTFTTYYKKLCKANYIIDPNYRNDSFGFPLHTCWMCKRADTRYQIRGNEAFCYEYTYDCRTINPHRILGRFAEHRDSQDENSIIAEVSVILNLKDPNLSVDTINGGVTIGFKCPLCENDMSSNSWSFKQGYVCECSQCNEQLLLFEKTTVEISKCKSKKQQLEASDNTIEDLSLHIKPSLLNRILNYFKGIFKYNN